MGFLRWRMDSSKHVFPRAGWKVCRHSHGVKERVSNLHLSLAAHGVPFMCNHLGNQLYIDDLTTWAKLWRGLHNEANAPSLKSGWGRGSDNLRGSFDCSVNFLRQPR